MCIGFDARVKQAFCDPQVIFLDNLSMSLVSLLIFVKTSRYKDKILKSWTCLKKKLYLKFYFSYTASVLAATCPKRNCNKLNFQYLCSFFQHGVFSKMYGLRTLKVTAYSNVRDFNVPKMLSYNAGLENLLIEVDDNGVEFGKEMYGPLPNKLDNITITGRALKYLTQYLLSVSV